MMHLLFSVYFRHLFLLNFLLETVPALEMLSFIFADLYVMYIYHIFNKQGPLISQ
jgi:hypothetical protein